MVLRAQFDSLPRPAIDRRRAAGRVPLLRDDDKPGDQNTLSTSARAVELQPADGGILRIATEGEPASWFPALLDQMTSLLALSPGWNGHAAAPVPGRAAATLFELVGATFDDTTPLPFITPLSSGGLQLEWHEPDLEIEVAIDADGTAHVWYEDTREGAEDEFTERDVFPRLRRIVAELARRS